MLNIREDFVIHNENPKVSCKAVIVKMLCLVTLKIYDYNIY